MQHQSMKNKTTCVLIVDDEEGIVEIFCRRLTKMGYQVSAYTSALQALTDFRQNSHKYHAIITDFMMPEMDGANLARTIKLIRPDVPIILCTGGYGSLDNAALQESGIDHILYKPVAKKAMADLLTQVICTEEF